MKIKVTPVSRKFGKYLPGDPFELPARAAKLYIKIGRLAAVTDEQIERAEKAMQYQTRAMQAAPAPAAETAAIVAAETTAAEVDSAGVEWNAEIHAANKLKKADGTWRRRAGRSAASTEE